MMISPGIFIFFKNFLIFWAVRQGLGGGGGGKGQKIAQNEK